eukprot:GDKH01018193.1.p6 GENE.GDKH01018193.1~~GDKH01018193.1.p6  ORF type:complete len:65 (+),score=3.34 GDKH01018193.1:1-195(+)
MSRYVSKHEALDARVCMSMSRHSRTRAPRGPIERFDPPRFDHSIATPQHQQGRHPEGHEGAPRS